jgi:regulator of sigma E protease
MTLLLINWPQVLLQAGYLIFSLSILVIIHELGHYLTAKWFHCRVEKFYLFFDPWFSLFKTKIGETVYGVGWLPLGGYVKIAGMVDESMDKEQMKQPPQPWEFRSKPAWQRLIIMLGGVTMNVLLAFFIYAMILYTWGEYKMPNESAKYGVWVTDSLMHDIGLRNGDKIISVNGEPIEYFDDIPSKILLGNQIKVYRDGKIKNISIPVNMIERLVEKKGKRSNSLIMPRTPLIAGPYDEGDSSSAMAAGLRGYDRIIAVDSTKVEYFDELATYLNTKRNDSVSLIVQRNQQTLPIKVPVDEDGKIGINGFSEAQYDSLGIFKQEHQEYSFLASLPAGVKKTGQQLNFYIQQFQLILNPKTGAYKGLGGFKTMASIFPTSGWNWEAFWKITAFFSIILAFMNLLPIPALDGGHVLFTLIEMASGRKPSDKFLEYAQIAGMVVLFALMLFANGNDWFGWGRGR